MANPNIKVNTGDTAKYIVYGVVGIAVLAVAYFGILKPILNSLGITKDAQDREAENVQEDVTRTQVLSDLMYKSNKNKVTISSAKANASANEIYNAKWGGWGGLSDKEDQAVGAITSAGSLVNVSYIAYVFQKNYNVSLESYLNSFLESDNWITIDGYLKKTKNY
jgi:hypothetical protein